jgi:hypothetical protein
VWSASFYRENGLGGAKKGGKFSLRRRIDDVDANRAALLPLR